MASRSAKTRIFEETCTTHLRRPWPSTVEMEAVSETHVVHFVSVIADLRIRLDVQATS